MTEELIGAKIVRIASNEAGYVETPPNSNKTKYGQWFGFDGVAWCGMFVSWVNPMRIAETLNGRLSD